MKAKLLIAFLALGLSLCGAVVLLHIKYSDNVESMYDRIVGSFTDSNTSENTEESPYPLKPENEYPLIEELNNHDLYTVIKNTYKEEDENWIWNLVENEENHIIGLAYEDLKTKVT